MNKNLITIIGGLILASIFLSPAIIANKTSAYNDKTTHPNLTREIISFYELSTGKKFTDEERQWIIQGSTDEDFAPRWLNHFYDPVYERGLTTKAIGINGYSAKSWTQYSSYQKINLANIGNLWTNNGPVISGSWWGDFSYETAVKNYSENKEKESYLALGHVLHLVEDMAVPEHTRNDSHSGGNMSSYYENWTAQNSSSLAQDLGKRLFGQGNKPVIYTDLESYFNNLAAYTNSHFFSPRTINSSEYQKPKIVFEDGNFAYGKDENGELFDLAVTIVDKSLKKSYSLKNQILQEYWLRLSRQAVINGAGVVELFLNQAEAARRAEVAKQKINTQQTTQKSSLISQIISFFSSPEMPSNEPVLVINSKSQAQSKIKAQLKPSAPQQTVSRLTIAKTPKQILVDPSVKNNLPIVSQNTLANSQTQTNQTTSQISQQSQTNTPIVYGGGGGNSSSNSNVQQTTPVVPVVDNSAIITGQANNTQKTASNATTTENLNVSTFKIGDFVINEIMYNPEGTDDKHEWIEIYNNSGREIILTGGVGGWKFDDGATSLHGLNEPPTNGSRGSMAVAAGGYLVLADNAETFVADHQGFGGTVIDTVMDLKNSTSTIKAIKIISPSGAIIDEVLYSNSWGGDGNGKTLERKLAAGGSNDAANWAQSTAPGGTPGAANNWELPAAQSAAGSSATTTLAAATSSPPLATSTPATVTSTSTTPLLGLGTNVAATTTITTNSTWTSAGSPYRLFFDSQRRPTVAAGAILTIEPGVKIIPQGGGYTAFEIQGTLNAIATSGAPIVFTSTNDADGDNSTVPQSGEWLNVSFSRGAQANLDYVEFHYGGQGLERPVKEMVKAIGAAVNINHSTFTNSQSIALRLVDSNGAIENSIFSDNACGISVDSLVNGDGTTNGGCAGSSGYFPAVAETAPQIKNNQFVRNRLVAVETRNGASPVLNGNIFTDNGYPVRIESSYPAITNSKIINSTTSPDILNGIAIDGYTHFRKDFTLKKDLPYILETNDPAHSPYVDAGAVLTIEPGAIFKTNNVNSALFIDGSLIASTTPDNPVVFTSLKDDAKGGDTNGDGLITSPQNNDWASIKFNAGSSGILKNVDFYYGGYGYIAPPPSGILIESFDNYSAGPLSGQGDWGSGSPSNQIAVTSTTTHNGVNSVKLSGGSGATVYRVLTQPIVQNGTLSFWTYYNSLGNQGISIIDSNNNTVASVYYDYGNHNCLTSDGNCWALMGDGGMGHFVRTGIQTTENAWHLIELEVGFSDKKIRIRQDGGNWSDWVISDRANLGRIRFDRGYGDVFYDTFVYTPNQSLQRNPMLSIDSGAAVVVQ